MEYQVDSGVVLAILAEKAQTEPLLAAWLEAAQWQAVAVKASTNGTPIEEQAPPDPGATSP